MKQHGRWARNVLAAGVALALGAAAWPGGAEAASVRIVAIGASNTDGMKLSRAEAYPAQLERILRAKGIDAEVINAGVSGETTENLRDRIESDVPPGTSLVILQPGSNDGRGGRRQGGRIVDPAETRANLDAMVASLQARGITVAMFNGFGGLGQQVAAQHGAVFLGRFANGVSPAGFQPDGVHLTAEGYATVAERIAPRIIAALRGGRRR